MIRILLILIFSSLTVSTAFAKQPSVHVLCYHAFIKKRNKFCFSIDELRSHILFYKRSGFRFVTISDIFNGRISGNKNILVTVDDGNKSVYRAYYDLFRPYNIRPLLAIYPSVIGRKSYALTWDELNDLANSGCDIASHGYHHRKIDRRLFERERKSFSREIYYSKKILEDKLKRKIDIFVYPYGVSSDVTVGALKKAGYKYAFTIDNGGIELPLGGRYNMYKLPRYMITRSNWKWCFNRIAKNSLLRVSKKIVIKENAKPDKIAQIRDKKHKKKITVNKRDDRIAYNIPQRFESKPPNPPPIPQRGHKKNSIFHLPSQGDRAGNILDLGKKENREPKQIDHDNIFTLKYKSNIYTSSKGNPLEYVSVKDAPLKTESDNRDILLGSRVEKIGNETHKKMKEEYYSLALKSYRSYTKLVNMVRLKAIRIKERIKTFIMKIF